MLAPEKTSEVAALLQQGVALARQGQKDYAKQVLQQAAEVDPNNEAVWMWLASLYSEPAEVNIAAYCLQRVVTINPANARAAAALQAIVERVSAAPGQTQAQPAPQPAPQPASARENEQPAAQIAAPTQEQTQVPEPEPIQAGEPADWGQAAQEAQAAHPEPQAQARVQPAQPVGQPEVQAVLGYDELKRRGIVAAKGGRTEEARAYLLAATDLNDADAETWHWLATVVDDPEDKQIALENVLTLDPLDQAARAAWEENNAILEARQSVPAPVQQQPVAANAPVAIEDYFSLHSGPLTSQHMPRTESESTPEKAQAAPVAHMGGGLLMNPAGVGPQMAGAQGKSDSPGQGSMIAGKYRVLAVNPGPAGTDYTVCEAGQKRFYTLRSQSGEIDQLKKARANYVVHERTPYTVVPIGTNGFTLRNFVSTVGVMPPDLAVGYALEMARTLEERHAKGPTLTANRRITPDTVAFDAEGEINLEPEGLKPPSSDAQVNPFLPPEQLSYGGIAPTSDIYAVGALVFYMLTGDTPPTPDNMPRKQGDSFTPDHFPGYPNIPGKLAKVLATALQTNPQERYATAKELSEALAATGLARPARRRGSTNFVLGAVGLVAVAVLGLLVVTGRLGNIKLPFVQEETQQVVYILPTATPAPAEPTLPPPPPLAGVQAHSVDTRRFPTNALFFSAVDAAGAPLTGLTTPNVKVTDNGGEATHLQLAELARTTDSVSVIFALDNSTAMKGKPMDDAKTAIHQFTGWLQPGDQMALLTFGGGVRNPLDYTVSKTEFLNAVDAVQAGGKPDVFPSVAQAAGRTATQPQGGYTAMIIISNGGLPSGKAALQDTIHSANLANLPVFYVGLDKKTYPAEVAKQLAGGTGGMAVVAEVDDAGGATMAIKKVDQAIHNVYKLLYDSPNRDTKGEHTVVLTVNSGGVEQSDTHKYQVLK